MKKLVVFLLAALAAGAVLLVGSDQLRNDAWAIVAGVAQQL
jgi:hypothetical protein